MRFLGLALMVAGILLVVVAWRGRVPQLTTALGLNTLD